MPGPMKTALASLQGPSYLARLGAPKVAKLAGLGILGGELQNLADRRGRIAWLVGNAPGVHALRQCSMEPRHGSSALIGLGDARPKASEVKRKLAVVTDGQLLDRRIGIHGRVEDQVVAVQVLAQGARCAGRQRCELGQGLG